MQTCDCDTREWFGKNTVDFLRRVLGTCGPMARNHREIHRTSWNGNQQLALARGMSKMMVMKPYSQERDAIRTWLKKQKKGTVVTVALVKRAVRQYKPFQGGPTLFHYPCNDTIRSELHMAGWSHSVCGMWSRKEG